LTLLNIINNCTALLLQVACDGPGRRSRPRIS
jgi:hypothetical protein